MATNRVVDVANKLLAFTVFCLICVNEISAISFDDGVIYFRQSEFFGEGISGASEAMSAKFKDYGTGPNVNGQDRRVRKDVSDKDCQIVDSAKLRNKGVHNYTFQDSNENLALLWTGPSGQNLLALTTLEYTFFAAPSHLWVSKDFGNTFKQVDDQLEHAIVRGQNGIFRHRTHFEKVILVTYSESNPYSTKFFVTSDGGDSFEKVDSMFYPEGPLLPHTTEGDWLLAHSPNDDYKLWISKDFGRHWKMLKKNVVEFSWGTKEQGTQDMIYASLLPEDKRMDSLEALVFTLVKMDTDGNIVAEMRKNVYNFGCEGKFLFVATDKEGTDAKNRTKVLHVSTDGGETWNIAQLPGIHDDMFISVLDMSEGMIIVHVDDPGDTGQGKIYTSDADGLIFSQSLDKHLFPNGNVITDFIKVASMRGVYMASQLDSDSSIHTMITFDRGGEWDYVDAPKGMTCKEGVQPCKLQIHSRYSILKEVNVPSMPLSIPAAPGLIIAHGNVADGLEVTPPDVFVTSDGGYNWNKALDGPHQYAITNFGGLIVAISKAEDTTDTIWFSYDEGHCWHEYKFTDEKLVITGLLPEPSSKSLNISIWGFGAEDHLWRAFTIDFSTVLTRKCGKDDFVLWQPHENNGKDGCFLGLTESFKKVKPDSFCRISQEFEVVAVDHTPCKCTKVDFECDYGFYRKDESAECDISPFNDKGGEIVCENGEETEIKSLGYRKIPGDVCEGGWHPSRSFKDLKKKCPGWEQESNYSVQQKHTSTAVIVSVLFIIVGVAIITLYLMKAEGSPCKPKSGKTYRYSELSQEEHDEAIDLSANENTYHDDSDDDILA